MIIYTCLTILAHERQDMIFTENRIVEVLDTNSNDTIRPSALLRFMQEAANHNMRKCRPTYEELFADGLAFILSRMSVKCYDTIHAYDELTVQTWPVYGRGVTFPRSYRILRDGKVVAEGDSTWALVDTKNRRLLKCDEIDMSSYTFDEAICLPLRFRIPRDAQMCKVGEHEVAYSETDCNRHMNNPNYPDMICNFIPEIDKKEVREFIISFASEAPYKERLSVEMLDAPDEDGVYYFRTLKSGATNIEARVVTKEI